MREAAANKTGPGELIDFAACLASRGAQPAPPRDSPDLPDPAGADPAGAPLDVAGILGRFRQAVPGCHVAAFIDLTSEMVLAVSARSKQPQERLDALAERAAELFAAPMAALSDAAGVPAGDSPPDFFLSVTPENLLAFIRTGTDAPEALGLVCAPGADVEALLRQGSTTLAAIGVEG